MLRRVVPAGVGLLVLVASACTTTEDGKAVAAAITTTTTAPPLITTTTPPPTTTTTPSTPPIPKPKSPQKVQVGSGSSVPMKKAYHMAYVQVVSIKGGEVAVFADWAPGSAGEFACYNNCSLSAGNGVSVSGLGPGSVVSLNNLVLVVDKVSGSHAQVTVGTLH